MTEAILDTGLPDADRLIGHVLSSRLNAYLVRDIENGRIGHRLIHERLSELLREPASGAHFFAQEALS